MLMISVEAVRDFKTLWVMQTSGFVGCGKGVLRVLRKDCSTRHVELQEPADQYFSISA